MATQSVPSTPKLSAVPTPMPDESRTPGKWRHPQLNEIVKRQNAATFGDRNMKSLVWNSLALVMTWVFGSTLNAYLHGLQTLIQYPTYPDLLPIIAQLFFIINIGFALYPLFRPKDDLSDIPLTPTQRSLLGLDPSVTPPPTPGSSYVTPPRYRLSRSASPASRSTSPFSPSASLSGNKASGGTSFSPSNSPLLYKAVSNGSKEPGRRQSFGSSPLGRNSPVWEPFRESSIGPATPSPTPASKRTSIAMSNKWLYERSRRLSTSQGGF
ncbi:Nuclear pore complex component [Aspergillus sclerotialis]|uniref:Nuclear pore complex component n=1 Tax=Aspergillus sclerotialis TaxID=2070753 RepID=A0A3A2ZQP0_9EURO|nr:Nuclear pore complex component [Aspergillus sclerotialis]